MNHCKQSCRSSRRLALSASAALTIASTALLSTAAIAADAPKTIEFIPSSNATPYFLQEYEGVKEEAAKYGYRTIFQAPSVSVHVSKQIGMVYTAVTRHVDGIILVPYSPTALLPPVKKAMAANIPVIATDSTLTPMKAVSFTGVPNEKAAAAVAKFAANAVNGKGEYAIIDYNLSTTSGRARKKGFQEEMAKHPGMKFAGIQISHSLPETAMKEATTMLERNPNINVIFGANDRSALGVAQAVKRMHLENKVTVVGFDADLGEIDYIKSGVIKASVLQSPITMGKTAVDMLHKVFTGKKSDIPKYQPLPYHLVTSKNYSSPESVKAIQQYIKDYKN
ncbi:sugar ABC transporter substrate-binding protein [Salinisphaera hydrothermalis]|uniref:sugar ABC transporter substrate-binding protein n=1 Tax=Salinisphaera hydrothermalis TaxID=563188 RepID=UPI00334235DF